MVGRSVVGRSVVGCPTPAASFRSEPALVPHRIPPHIDSAARRPEFPIGEPTCRRPLNVSPAGETDREPEIVPVSTNARLTANAPRPSAARHVDRFRSRGQSVHPPLRPRRCLRDDAGGAGCEQSRRGEGGATDRSDASRRPTAPRRIAPLSGYRPGRSGGPNRRRENRRVWTRSRPRRHTASPIPL